MSLAQIAPDLDERDRAILKYLHLQGRASVRTIARSVGLPPSTVHARMARLERQGVVTNYSVNLEPQRLGLGFVAFILVSGTAERYLEEEFLARPEVEEVAGITGEYDLLLKVRLPSLEDFNTFLMDFRDRYDAYLDKTITMVRTANLKE